MQIILLHPRFTHAKSVTLTRRHLLALFIAFVLAVILGASFLSYLVFSNASVSYTHLTLPTILLV